MPRILILQASVGSGHQRGGGALATAFARKPGCEVRVEDTLDYGSRVFRRAYTQSYLGLKRTCASTLAVDPAIAESKQIEEMRARHGFPVDPPLICLFGGGLDVERVRRVVLGLLARDMPGTLVVAGRNTALTEALADLSHGPKMHLHLG